MSTVTPVELPAAAYEWHRKPFGGSVRSCPLCHIEGRTKGVHRAVRPDEGIAAVHEVRLQNGDIRQSTTLPLALRPQPVAVQPLPISPYSWHRKPFGESRSKCSVCGFPADERGEHRAVSDSEQINARYLARRKDGVEKPVFRRHRSDRKRLKRIKRVPRVVAGVYSGMSLLEFGDWLTGKSMFDADRYRRLRRTIAYAEEVLGRPPMLDDLSTNLLDLLGDAMRAAAVEKPSGKLSNQKTINNVRWSLIALWRAAANAGLDVAPPPLKSKRWADKRPVETQGGNVAPSGPPDSSMPLVTYFNLYYRRMKLRGKSPETIRQYIINLNAYGRFLEREATLADLNDEVASASVGWHLDTGRSAATANKYRSHLLAVWRYAARKKHVDEFPDVARLPEPKRLPSSWTIEELSAILGACQVLPQFAPKAIAGIPWARWWTALVLTCYDAGGRISALKQARLRDLNLATGRLAIPAEFQKQNQDQTFTLSSQTIEALRATVEHDPKREVVFPWPWSPSGMWKWYDRILDQAGLPHGRRDKFHRLRRTSATWAEIAIGPGVATRHLGHASPKVTERYIDTSLLPSMQVGPQLPRPTIEVKGGAE